MTSRPHLNTRMSVQGSSNGMFVPSEMDNKNKRPALDLFTRWRSIFWIGLPAHISEHFVGVDLSALWRRHIIWSKPAGRVLREALTQRFASTTVFLSLILGTEIRVLFSPSKPADNVRLAFKASDYSLEYFTGVALALSIFFSISALIANFTAWGVFTVVGDENLKLIARSSLGLYGAQLPNRLVVGVIYLFFIWVVLFWFVIMPTYTATGLTVAGALMIIHIVSTYSALARIIMDTGAMSVDRILDQEIEEEMMPRELAEELYQRMMIAREHNVHVSRKYRDIHEASVRASAIRTSPTIAVSKARPEPTISTERTITTLEAEPKRIVLSDNNSSDDDDDMDNVVVSVVDDDNTNDVEAHPHHR